MAEEVDTLDIDSKGLEKTRAFSMDIGGSLAKIVYTTDEGDVVRLHFMCYPRTQTKEAVQRLKDKLDGRQPDGTLVNVCGVGFQEYGEYIRQELNVNLKVNEELNCFVEGFHYMLGHVALEKLVHVDGPEYNQVIQQVASLTANFVNSLSGKGKHWEVVTDEEDKEIKFPILLCMMGSGGGGIKIEADGSFQVCEAYTRCGRTILGLANLLVGTKSFDELMELASKGDASQLHVQAKHLLSGAGDVYDQVPGEFMVYTFGQAATKDKDQFKKEDIAAAMVGMLCQDIAQTCYLTAAAHNISHIFFCGSVTGASSYIREQVKMVLSVKGILNSLSKRCYCYFLKFGGYYGAIGALLRSLRPKSDSKE